MRTKIFEKYRVDKSPRKKSFFLIPIIVLLIIVYIIVALILPPPKVKATKASIPAPSAKVAAITWPKDQQEAIGASGYGVLATNGEQKSAPIASIAKTMLALGVLKQKPLKVGEQGPTITMTAKDVELFNIYFAQNGSVLPVEENEQLTEYQAIQALLVPSGDNIADTLANWAFGSVDNYLTFANDFAAKLNLQQTHFADAGGLSPQTVSSAQNLIILGEAILAEPVLAEIVNQSKITLPVVGQVSNYNTILGQDNIVGIKTGNTDEAGGCFLFATKNKIEDQEITLIGAILGAASRNQALNDTKNFLEKNVKNFQIVTIVKAGEVVANYNTPWGKSINVIAEKDLSILEVTDQKIETKASIDEIIPGQNKGAKVGTLTAVSGQAQVTINLVLENKLSKPSIFWKILHP